MPASVPATPAGEWGLGCLSHRGSDEALINAGCSKVGVPSESSPKSLPSGLIATNSSDPSDE
jgi:hypothetical protein